MTSTNSYIPADLETTDMEDIRRALLAGGYTNPLVIRIDYDTETPPVITNLDVRVDEDSITSTTMKNAINDNNPTPSLSTSSSSITCVGDGTATTTVTISDSRGASASGKTCKIKLLTGSGLVKLTPSVNFDGSGDAVFTLGATPAADMCSMPFNVEFYVDTEPEVKPIEVTCQFTIA